MKELEQVKAYLRTLQGRIVAEIEQLTAKLAQAESALAELYAAGVDQNTDIERYYSDF